MKNIQILAVGLFMTAFLFIGTMLGHNLIESSSMSPASGITITNPETTLSGKFWNSGCGLGATIDIIAESGTILNLTKSCADGTWSWSADWSGYDPGWQTVTVNFQSGYHGGKNEFVHTGTATAEYFIAVPSTCDEPAAPAIANQYMHQVLGITNRDTYNTIIPEVAHAMNAGLFGDNPCAPGYDDAVIAYVTSLLN